MKKDAPAKSKFRMLKRRIGKPHYAVVGLLESLWMATQVDASAGDIGRLSNEEIAAAIEWEGDADLLIKTLVDCGWLDADPEFRLIVHDWSEHVPTFIKGAFEKHGKQFADEVAKQRPKHGAKHDALEPAKDSAKHGALDGALARPILFQSIPVQSSQVQKSADADFPPSLQTDQFVAAWADWSAHRTEIRKPLKPTQTKKQLRWLASLGHDLAVRTIEYTIEKGWQGLRVPEGEKVPAQKPRFPSDEELANWNPTTGIE